MDSSSPTAAQLEARIRQQEVVAELGQQALEADNLDELMHDVTVAVNETLDTDYCHVLERLPDGDTFLLRQGVGWKAGTIGNATVPTEQDSQAGYTRLSKEPVIVDDLRDENRFVGNDLLIDHGVVSGITVLIGSVEAPWGVLGAFATEQREFTEWDATFVQSVANILASTINNEQTESELEEIYGRISDAFFAIDEEWQFAHLNEKAHEVINPEGRELVGKNVWEQFPEATERKFKPKYEHAMYNQETVSFEEYYPDPLDAWFEVRAYPSETGLSVYFRDITERKQRERELAESERRYRALAEHFPNGLVTLFDRELEYELAAGRAFDQIDVDPEDLEGQPLQDVWDEENADALRPLFEAALDGEERSVELTYAGREWVVHAVPVADDTGNVFAGMTMAQDITERKQREQRLGELVEKLGESNERLEQFAYAASHDLQEPLRMVSSYLQLIENRYADSLDEDAEEFIAFAVDGADRMRDMIEGLLQYSRVETQGDPFDAVALGPLFEEVRKDLQVKIEESDATVTVDSLPTVEGDRDQLRQVFQNLLDNAIEYSGDVPPKVHITAERDDEKWVISVRDEGIGIDSEDADRIFQVFQSLQGPDDGGTGIGLALTERIVERHGGDIWVESEPGEGATFSFTLPAIREESPA